MLGIARRWFGYKVVRIEANVGRLDAYLKTQSPLANWGKVQALIKKRKIIVRTANQKKVTSNNYQLCAGDEIQIVDDVFQKYFEVAKFSLKKKEYHIIDDADYVDEILDHIIVHKSEDFIVINKPPGMYSQGTPVLKLNISSILNSYYKHFNVDKYSFIVHRLDKSVSGLMLIATDRRSAIQFSDELKNRQVDKIYHGLVLGIPKFVIEEQKTQLEIEVRIGFNDSKQKAFIEEENDEAKDKETRKATCNVRVMKVYAVKSPTESTEFDLSQSSEFEKLLEQLDIDSENSTRYYSLVEYDLISGKKHQLRIVSQKVLETPIVGDHKYGYPMPKEEAPEHVVRKVLSDPEIKLSDLEKPNHFLKDQYRKGNFIYLQSVQLAFNWDNTYNDEEEDGGSIERYEFKAAYAPHMQFMLDLLSPKSFPN